MSLILDNCYKADEKTVRSIECPEVEVLSNHHFVPVSHGDFIDVVLAELDARNFEVDTMNLALAKGKKIDGVSLEGARMFGEIVLKGDNSRGYNMAVGFRNGLDKSMRAGTCIGESVCVCGNMIFSANLTVFRKHVGSIIDDLPVLIGKGFDQYAAKFEERVKQITCWQNTEIEDRDSDHLLMEAFRQKAIPAAQIPKVLHEYTNPHHPEFLGRNVWSLHNAFTQVHKGRNMDPNTLLTENLRLSKVFEDVFPVTPALAELN